MADSLAPEGKSGASGPMVSIIVPVFNTAEYLDECLGSIIAQTLRDIEIICVDDGSTDDSPAKLATWAAKDSRIRVLRQENHGGGAARNTGMDAATGEWLFFCDSDDACEPEMLEEMVRTGDGTDSQVVVAPRALWDEALRIIVSTTRFSQRIVSSAMPFPARALGADIFVFSGNTAWNKLFRRTFALKFGIRFQESRRSNDLSFVNCALALSDRISVCDKALYKYRSGRVGGAVYSAEDNPSSLFEAFGCLRSELASRRLFDNFATAFAKALFISSGYQMCRFRSAKSVAFCHARLRETLLELRRLCDLSDGDVLNEFQKENYRVLLESEDPIPFLLACWRSATRRASDLSLRVDNLRLAWMDEVQKRKDAIASFRADREKAVADFQLEREKMASSFRAEREKVISSFRAEREKVVSSFRAEREKTISSFRAEREILLAKLRDAQTRLTAIERDCHELENALSREKANSAQIEKSLSWRMTSPFRRAACFFERFWR